MTDKPRRAIAIMAKAPHAGQVKTRLVPLLSASDAAALAAAFIADIACRLKALAQAFDAVLFLYHTPDQAADEFNTLTGEIRLRPQGTGNLGHRMHAVAVDLRAEGFTQIVLLGADSPTLPAAHIAAAFNALEMGAHVAICPADDGGYVLLGVDAPHGALFEAIPWGTDTVYSLSVKLARNAGLTVHELAGWYDVDTADDLARLSDELNRGANNLAPRTSRLLGELRF